MKIKKSYDHPELILKLFLEREVLMTSPNPAVDDVEWDAGNL